MELVSTSGELCKSLCLDLRQEDGSWRLRRQSGTQKLPGQPRIGLDTGDCLPYFRKEHLTEQLDRLVPYIRFFGIATPTFIHISPLHHQAARQRSVVVVESPHLHLVWYYEHIYLKPIPEYMLSSSFWEYLKETDQKVLRACAGFMRSYCYLIQYEIDFKKATSDELRLIPAEVEGRRIDFERFVKFMEPFAALSDEDVNARFTFGELRLTRLNMLTRIFLWKATYHHVHAQWTTFLGRFCAPLVALFAVLSTALSAMQVGLATIDVSHQSAFAGISWRFALFVIVLMLVIATVYVALVAFMLISDFIFAKHMEYKKRKPEYQGRISEIRSGVV